jgi:hypothetical protein
MNWYMIKTKDTYVSKLCIFLFFTFFEFFKTFVGRFLIGENISIWMSPFRFESSCARDGGMWWIIFQRGGPYLVVEVRGILLPWVILRREGRDDHIWISIFLWRQFRGVGLCPYMAYGRGLPIYGDAATPRVFGVPKKTSHPTTISQMHTKKISIQATGSMSQSSVNYI